MRKLVSLFMILAVALFFNGTALAANECDTDQSGSGNSAACDQTGASNSSGSITQTGDDNFAGDGDLTFGVVQMGNNQSSAID